MRLLAGLLLAALVSSTASAAPPFGNEASEWSGVVSDVFDGTLRETNVTLNLTPSSATKGRWRSSPVNACAPTQQLDGAPNDDYGIAGTWRGKYALVGNTILLFEIRNPNDVLLGYGRSCFFEVSGSRLYLTESGTMPHAVTKLRRVK